VTQSLLDAIRELESHDAVLASEIAELMRLEREIAALRAGAEALLRFRVELPERSARAQAELQAAEAEVARRAEAVRSAQAEVARAKSDEARAAAERAVATAETSLRTAEARVAREREALAALEREAEANEAEAALLEEQARELGAGLGEMPEPGLERLEPWGARVRASVFAQRTHAEAERQRVIEEATELGSAATGESLAGSGVEAVRARVESALSRG
jgi:chromosome segregation ATPase